MKEFITNDLSFTAYLMMNGCKLLDARKMGKSYKFSVDIGDEDAGRLKIQYINSESSKFDASVRDLKKILFSQPSDGE